MITMTPVSVIDLLPLMFNDVRVLLLYLAISFIPVSVTPSQALMLSTTNPVTSLAISIMLKSVIRSQQDVSNDVRLLLGYQ